MDIKTIFPDWQYNINYGKTSEGYHYATYGNWGGAEWSGGHFAITLTEPFPFLKDPTTGKYDATQVNKNFILDDYYGKPVDMLDYSAMLHDYRYQLAENYRNIAIDTAKSMYGDIVSKYETDPYLWPNYKEPYEKYLQEIDAAKLEYAKAILVADQQLVQDAKTAMLEGNLSPDGMLYSQALITSFDTFKTTLVDYPAIILASDNLGIPEAIKKLFSSQSTIPGKIAAAQQAAHKLAQSEGFPAKDPIAIDLDRDGKIDTIGLNSNIHFDMDGDGIAQHTSWFGILTMTDK